MKQETCRNSNIIIMIGWIRRVVYINNYYDPIFIIYDYYVRISYIEDIYSSKEQVSYS